MFAADAAPTSIISVCRSPVRGEIFVLNGTRDRVKRRSGETETRRSGDEEQKCQQIFTHHALRLYALRFTHYAQPISGLTPLLPNPQHFTHYALRFTHHASRITLNSQRSTRNPFFKIANFAVKSVKSRITNHASDGYQMTPEVVII